MTQAAPGPSPAAFIAAWSPSGGAELANSQHFLLDLCDLLGVPRPDPKVPTEDPAANAYLLRQIRPTSNALIEERDQESVGRRLR
jgi:hypothetical protein